MKMGKLIFLFAFALIALQGTHGASFKVPRNEMDDLLGEFLEAINEANGVISFVGDELSSIARDYEHEINEIVEEKSSFPEIEDLSESINKIESEVTDDSKHCIDSAWRMVMLLTDEVKRDVDNCVSEARTTGGETQSILQNLDGKATDLRVRLVTGMHKCMEIGEDIDEVNVKCLKDLIVVLKRELLYLEKEVEDVHNSVHKITENGIGSLRNCLDQTKEDLILKTKTTLDVLKQCTQIHLALFKIAPRGIIDLIEELKKKIETIIEIISNLPTSIDEIPDKIQEIISHLNIIAISKQLEDEIDDIISDGGSKAEDCRPEAEKRLDEITDSAQKTAKACMDATDEKVEEIKSQITAVVDEGKQLLSDFNQMILNCIWDNKLNPIGFAKCLQGRYDEFKQKVSDLQQKATELAWTIVPQADEVLKTLAQCVNKVQIDTVNQGQVLIKDVEKCVRTIHSFY